MYGDEKRIVEAFGVYLENRGWRVKFEVDHCDVEAVGPDGQLLLGEAKGRTAAIGLDIDTLYGQLLRRMKPELAEDTRFAVVVPREGVGKAQRVSRIVRERLAIDIYAVDDAGQVSHID